MSQQGVLDLMTKEPDRWFKTDTLIKVLRSSRGAVNSALRHLRRDGFLEHKVILRPAVVGVKRVHLHKLKAKNSKVR